MQTANVPWYSVGVNEVRNFRCTFRWTLCVKDIMYEIVIPISVTTNRISPAGLISTIRYLYNSLTILYTQSTLRNTVQTERKPNTISTFNSHNSVATLWLCAATELPTLYVVCTAAARISHTRVNACGTVYTRYSGSRACTTQMPNSYTWHVFRCGNLGHIWTML